MATLIEAASLVKYNANVRGNDVGDCVCRAISLAFDLTYSQTSKLLNEQMKLQHKTQWNITPVFEGVIKGMGGSERRFADKNKETNLYPTVEEFADLNPEGCYLILCGKSGTDNKTSHLVCIIDNKIYDSWDSREYFAKSYYVVMWERHIADSNVDDFIDSLLENATNIADMEIDRLTQKWIKDGEQCKVANIRHYVSSIAEGYTLKLSCRFTYTIENDTYQDTHSLKFPMNVVLKPGISENEAEEFIKKTVKQRSYDRMYKVRETIKQQIDEFESKYAEDSEAPDEEWAYYTPQEKRFINQLPGKIRPYISYISIHNPGQYYDSYTIRIQRLPKDPNYDSRVTFEAYEARGAREMIERYVKTYERPWDDYDPEVEGYI